MRPSLLDRLVTLALFAIPLAFGLYALSLGQDSNWDLRNYHWYNPYAFLQNRLPLDLGVAHQATFYNPLVDLPVYLAGQAMPARLVGFGLGCVHGLNFVLLFVVAELLLADTAETIPAAGRRGAAALVALVGVLGAGHLTLVGTAFNDNVLSLLILGGAAIVLKHRQLIFGGSTALSRPAIRAVLAAGGLIGLAVGLKLPTASFAVGFCAAFLCAGGAFSHRFAQSVLFGCGVLAGFIVAGAPWMLVLWHAYHNPLFPYFNAVFHSPMALTESYRDVRFLPTSVADAIAFPILSSLDPMRVGEVFFRDFRIALAYVTVLISALLFIPARLRAVATPPRLSPGARYAIAAVAVSYVAWLVVFAVYRYIVPLEMLAPLVTVLAVASWPMSLKLRRVAIVAALAFVTVTTIRGDWGHQPWQPGPFVTADVPPVDDPGHVLAIVTGNNPVGWLVPSFPPEIPFIRIQGYLNHPGQPKNGLNDRARALIEGHTGPLYILFPEMEGEGAAAALGAYGLALDRDSCQPVRSNLGDYARWCRAAKTASEPST